MKKFVQFVLAVAFLAGIFLLAKGTVMNDLKVFKNALTEVDQWKTLM